MKINDGLTGAIAVAAGALLIHAASGLREIPGQMFGSRFFPSLVGIAVIGVGVLLIASALRQWKKEHQLVLISRPEWFTDKRGLRVLAMVVAPVLFLLFAQTTGFMAITILLLLALMLLLGTRPLHAIWATLLTTLILQVVFAELLRVPLPRGPLESMFF